MIRQALVIFSDNSGIWWLQFLKKGYRHCFIIIDIDQTPLLVDPTMKSFSFDFLDGEDLSNLVGFYKSQGKDVVFFTPEQNVKRNFSWSPFTCVEVVKRMLGIKNMFILTPWQLKKFLKRTKIKHNENSP